jgi:hypothetical protein
MWRLLNGLPVFREKKEDDLGGGGDGDDPPEDPPKKDDPPALSVDVLPEELKGLPAAEIKFHLGQMVEGIKTGNAERKTLQEQVRTLQTPVKPKEDDKPDKPLEEMILEDPEKAILTVLQKTGLADRFSHVESAIGETAFHQVAAKIPGFEEHEADVREILEKSTAVKITPEHVEGALDMVLGRKLRETQARDARAAANSDIPKDDPDKPKGDLPALSGLEKEIFDASGMSEEDWHKNKQTDFDIKVPTS